MPTSIFIFYIISTFACGFTFGRFKRLKELEDDFDRVKELSRQLRKK